MPQVSTDWRVGIHAEIWRLAKGDTGFMLGRKLSSGAIGFAYLVVDGEDRPTLLSGYSPSKTLPMKFVYEGPNVLAGEPSEAVERLIQRFERISETKVLQSLQGVQKLYDFFGLLNGSISMVATSACWQILWGRLVQSLHDGGNFPQFDVHGSWAPGVMDMSNHLQKFLEMAITTPSP